MLKKLCVIVSLFIATTAMAAVEVNKATAAELDGLSGIGPATTQLIVTERKKSEFKDWADLMKRVKGIGDARASKLSAAGLTVGGASYKGKSGKAPIKAGTHEKGATPALTPAAVNPADKKSTERKNEEKRS